ncbi:EGF-like domain-containing protein 2 [Liolophura sinensis]|uniref:EGF-like domain-containing protein 2 n=1 Tax=Liolophura sinensis TaxID=3198878 RepID=UPI00315990A1
MAAKKKRNVLDLSRNLPAAQRPYKPFSCQRVNSPCVAANGGQCQPDGVCTCTNNAFEGYNCGLVAAQRVTTVCDINCENNGICYNDGVNGHRCFCQPAFYGNRCQFNRVAILGCDDQTMTILVNPHETGLFNGRIYVRGLSNTPQCVVDVPAVSPNQGFTKTLSLDTTVGTTNPCRSGMEILDSGNIKRYTVIVQYDPAFIAWPDEIHTFQCSQSGSGQFIGIVLNGLTFNTNTDDRLTGLNVQANHIPANIAITRQPDRSVLNTGILMVGDDLFLEFSLIGTTTYTTLRVDELTAFDSNINPQMEKALIRNSCPVSLTNGITVSPLQKPNPGLVLVPFKMFKFMTTNSVYFLASTTMCTSASAANCAPLNCNGVANGFGRRKRESGTERGNLTTRVFVVTQGDTEVDLGTCGRDPVNRLNTASCFQNSTFLIVASLFGLLLIVAIIILALVCARAKQRHSDEAREFHTYSNCGLTKM